MDILMDILIEQIIIYGAVLAFCVIVVAIYLRHQKKITENTERKVEQAKADGVHEPVSLHPYIDLATCIGSAACISACPEKDILGIVNGKATAINASNCVGHGACFHACPVEAISLRIGTESRGVDLPHVNQNFESNMKGIYIAGELGGMGLIKNSVEQGQQAIEYIAKNKTKPKADVLDVVIVGAGPAGIAATLNARKLGLSTVTFEQDTLGGTVFSFPRAKIVMTAPMHLPLHGNVKLYDTSKTELLDLWNEVIQKNGLDIREKTKVENIVPQMDHTFKVITSKGDEILCHHVLLAIGRRGTPRKLGVPGEGLPNVAYRLLEPEHISGKKVIVVGGGDSAVESAMLLADQNEVVLSYRKDKFSRIKPKNRERIQDAIDRKSILALFNTNLVMITESTVTLKYSDSGETMELENDLVYIFAGGELPTSFLQNAGIEISKRFGYIVKKH